ENKRLMTRSPLSLAARALLIAACLVIPVVVQAQIPGGSSGREIPTEVEKTDGRVELVIERANDHYRRGKLNLEDNRRDTARYEFDKRVDEILMSGLDVRASQRLQTYYLELIERIYREEVPLIQQVAPQQSVPQNVAQNVPETKPAAATEVAKAESK